MWWYNDIVSPITQINIFPLQKITSLSIRSSKKTKFSELMAAIYLFVSVGSQINYFDCRNCKRKVPKYLGYFGISNELEKTIFG